MSGDLLIWLRDGLSGILLAGGAFFLVVGAIGLIRLPDFYTRLHAAGVTDTGGAILVLLGLLVHNGFDLVAVKLLLILLFFLLTSPTACHALANAAYSYGTRPIVAEDRTGDAEEDRPA